MLHMRGTVRGSDEVKVWCEVTTEVRDLGFFSYSLDPHMELMHRSIDPLITLKPHGLIDTGLLFSLYSRTCGKGVMMASLSILIIWFDILNFFNRIVQAT